MRSNYCLPVMGMVMCTLLLVGCGGGGDSGGSGGGGGGGGGGSSGTLSLSVSQLDFATTDPAVTPNSQFVAATITTTATGTLYLKIVVSGQIAANVTNITVTPPNSGQAEISVPTASVLGPGRYTGTISVTACTSGPDCTSGLIGTTQTIALTYTITGVSVAAASVNYTINDASVAADYSQSLNITAYPAYTVSTDADWVSVTPASGGTGAAQLTVNLDQNLVDNGESGPRLAHVMVAGQGGNTVSVPVNLVVAKPQIDQVTPYIAYTGLGATVTVRGQYLDLLSNMQLDFAPTIAGTGTAATSVVRVSPTEFTVTFPGMSAGKYLVRMHDAGGAVRDRSHAYLAVIDKPVYAATTLPYPDAAPALMAMVFDAERQALIVGAYHSGVSADLNEMIRYTYSGGGWSAPTSVTIPELQTLALSANGVDLLVASATPSLTGGGNQAHLDAYSPDTSGVRQSLDTGDLNATYSYIAFTGQNRALLMEYDPCCSGVFSVFDYSPKANLLTAPAAAQHVVERGSLSASGDGQRVVIGDYFSSTVGEYNASTDTYTWLNPSPGLVFAPQLDRTGAMLVNCLVDSSGSNTVYHFQALDRNWNLLGEVQATTPLGTPWFVLAPDGTRLYTYTMDNKLHTYDLASAPVGGLYAEIGTGTTLAGDPGVITGGFMYPLMMTITPDGGTVFIGSAAQIVVQPVN